MVLQKNEIAFLVTSFYWKWFPNRPQLLSKTLYFNPIHDGHFRGCSRMVCWGLDGQKGPPLLKSVTRTLQWWNLAELYLRRTKKYMNHVTHSLCSANISIFSLEISKSCYIKKYRYTLNFDAQFFSSNLFRVYKGFLIDMGIILMMSAKMTTLAFLKIKMFWNQGYDVIVPVHDVNNTILSRDSNYIVDIILLSCDQS